MPSTQNFKNWNQVVLYLQSFIPNQTSTKGYKAKDWGLSRTKKFLGFLDNPQEKIQVFHIAGTSGKGSTAFLLSQLLESQGWSVGLHLSPYLLDFRERFIINNKLPNKTFLTQKFNQFNSLLTQFLSQTKEKLSYFEIINCWTFWLFKQENLDTAVIEVGMGGRFDATNCVLNPDKICILNQTGLDHTDFLGNTPAKIATEQAEIIQKNNPAVLIQQEFLEAQEVFINKAKGQGSSVSLVGEETFLSIPEGLEKEPAFQILDLSSGLFQYFSTTQKQNFRFLLNLKGRYQIANTALALRALEIFLEKQNRKLDVNSIQEKLAKIQFRGRFEEVKLEDGEFWILDSAHNPQKIFNFIRSLEFYYPQEKFVFFLAFSHNKNFETMLNDILPVASDLIFTNFKIKTQGASKKALELTEVEKYLKSLDTKISASFISSPNQALLKVQKTAKEKQKKVVATGSIYFLSEVYEMLTCS